MPNQRPNTAQSRGLGYYRISSSYFNKALHQENVASLCTADTKKKKKKQCVASNSIFLSACLSDTYTLPCVSNFHQPLPYPLIRNTSAALYVFHFAILYQLVWTICLVRQVANEAKCGMTTSMIRRLPEAAHEWRAGVTRSNYHRQASAHAALCFYKWYRWTRLPHALSMASPVKQTMRLSWFNFTLLFRPSPCALFLIAVSSPAALCVRSFILRCARSLSYADAQCRNGCLRTAL